MKGNTTVTEFIFLAFTNFHQFHIFLFIVVLIIYVTCIIGNVTIIFLIKKDSSLHTPMYLFISIFAVLEIIFVSIILPKFLDILIAGKNRISFAGCFAQQYSANTMGIVECYLLTVMAFDRFLAINSPLHYSNIMSQLINKLAVFPWAFGCAISSIPTIYTARLDFCGPNELDHFFCDLAPLQKLACSDFFLSSLVTSSVATVTVLLPFMVIIGFYAHIIASILKIKSVTGKGKAFSTCSSHIIVASLFYGSGIIVYILPSGNQYDKFLALIYTVVTPLLNPFIYTLRNKDVKRVFLKCIWNLISPRRIQEKEKK